MSPCLLSAKLQHQLLLSFTQYCWYDMIICGKPPKQTGTIRLGEKLSYPYVANVCFHMLSYMFFISGFPTPCLLKHVIGTGPTSMIQWSMVLLVGKVAYMHRSWQYVHGLGLLWCYDTLCLTPTFHVLLTWCCKAPCFHSKGKCPCRDLVSWSLEAIGHESIGAKARHAIRNAATWQHLSVYGMQSKLFETIIVSWDSNESRCK